MSGIQHPTRHKTGQKFTMNLI